MTEFIKINLIENKEKGFIYPAAKLCSEANGTAINYSTIATAMVCVAEVCLDLIPKHQ